jgi:hypothetical protein
MAEREQLPSNGMAELRESTATMVKFQKNSCTY